MLKRYTFWLWAAVVFQLLTALIHSVGLFITIAPDNETERQLMQLMMTYKPDMGPGFHPTFGNLVTALSSCFSFLYLLGALINAFLLKKNADTDLMKGILLINILVFGASFVVMVIFAFFVPVILNGLTLLILVISYLCLALARVAAPFGLEAPAEGV